MFSAKFFSLSFPVNLCRGPSQVCNDHFLKIITIVVFFHAVGIRLSDKHLLYSLASVFEMVSSPAFNDSIFILSLPVAVPFFISRSVASTSHDVISGTSFWSVWIMVL